MLEIPQIPFASVINYQHLQSRAGSGGSKGDARDAPGSKFFQFHAVFGIIWQNQMLVAPRRVGAPPHGNPGSTTEGSFRKYLKSMTKVPSVLQKD